MWVKYGEHIHIGSILLKVHQGPIEPNPALTTSINKGCKVFRVYNIGKTTRVLGNFRTDDFFVEQQRFANLWSNGPWIQKRLLKFCATNICSQLGIK